MKLKIKILLACLGAAVALSSMLGIIVEYKMSLDTKKVIALAEKDANSEKEKEVAIEDEEKYQEELKKKARDKYDEIGDFYYGLAWVKLDDEYGYIDKDANEVIPVQFELANNFTNKNYAKVKKNGKWGYIDNKGDILIPIEYAYCGEVVNGIVAIGNGGRYGFMTISGNEVCPLLYDKVENFADTGLAKVILNKQYGFIDKKGEVVVPITTDYVAENYDFTGEWKQTDIHSSKANMVIIDSQLATSFNFRIVGKYFKKSETLEGTANIVDGTIAEYNYNTSDYSDVLKFSIIDDALVITSKNGGSFGLDKDISLIGTYTKENPKYTNDDTLETLFGKEEKMFDRIKKALGEEVYEDYFVYGFKNGEYTKKILKSKADIIQGDLYTVKVPTMEKDFRLLISDKNIYFFAKHEEIYKTDDENRQSIARMPSAVSFDEL